MTITTNSTPFILDEYSYDSLFAATEDVIIRAYENYQVAGEVDPADPTQNPEVAFAILAIESVSPLLMEKILHNAKLPGDNQNLIECFNFSLKKSDSAPDFDSRASKLFKIIVNKINSNINITTNGQSTLGHTYQAFASGDRVSNDLLKCFLKTLRKAGAMLTDQEKTNFPVAVTLLETIDQEIASKREAKQARQESSVAFYHCVQVHRNNEGVLNLLPNELLFRIAQLAELAFPKAHK